MRALIAEFIGTFTLMLSIVGAGLFLEPAGAGVVAIATAAMLALVSISYALGHVSGGHFNPAVSIGLVAAGRFELGHVGGYIGAQIAGGTAAVGLLALVLAGSGPTVPHAGFATVTNTFGGRGQLGLASVAVMEAVLCALLVLIVIGGTARRAVAGMAPVAIGFTYGLFHLIALPITTAGLNPARSTAVAIFGGAEALADLWLFWLAPIVGAVVGGLLGRWLLEE